MPPPVEEDARGRPLPFLDKLFAVAPLHDSIGVSADVVIAVALGLKVDNLLSTPGVLIVAVGIAPIIVKKVCAGIFFLPMVRVTSTGRAGEKRGPRIQDVVVLRLLSQCRAQSAHLAPGHQPKS